MSAAPEKLDRLAALLKRKPRTAKEIMKALGCCKPTAYQWVQQLRDRGEAVFELVEPATRPGPAPRLFGVR